MDRPAPVSFLINMAVPCVETVSGATLALDWDMLLFTIDFCLDSQLLWTQIFPIHGSPPNPL